MKIQIAFRLIIFSFLILFLPLLLQAQVKMDEEFSKLSISVREDLFQRLNKFVLTLQGEKWNDIYDFYWKQYVNGKNGLNKMTKEKYVIERANQSNNRKLKFVSFTPSEFRVVSFENEKFTVVIVEGCGEYEDVGKEKIKVKELSTVTAVLENKTWYFTDIERRFPSINCNSKAFNLLMEAPKQQDIGSMKNAPFRDSQNEVKFVS